MCLVLLQRNNRRFTEADGYSLSVGKLAQKPENVNRPCKNRIFLPRDFSQTDYFKRRTIPESGQWRMSLEQCFAKRRSCVLHSGHTKCF